MMSLIWCVERQKRNLCALKRQANYELRESTWIWDVTSLPISDLAQMSREDSIHSTFTI